MAWGILSRSKNKFRARSIFSRLGAFESCSNSIDIHLFHSSWLSFNRYCVACAPSCQTSNATAKENSSCPTCCSSSGHPASPFWQSVYKDQNHSQYANHSLFDQGSAAIARLYCSTTPILCSRSPAVLLASSTSASHASSPTATGSAIAPGWEPRI